MMKMVLKRVNNLFVILIILCSTSFFNLSALGSGQKLVELVGIFLILGLLAMHYIYGDQDTFKKNFTPFIVLIFLSAITSMITASYQREQTLIQSLFAQRALYYYFFYFLLHQLKIRTRDLEIIFVVFGILHIMLYLLQYFAYPKILFDVFMMLDRGTVRIYLPGSDYLAICYFMSMFAFIGTNKLRYLIYMLACFSIFVLLGGRQTMSLMAFVLILAVLFSHKVKSRFLVILLIVGAAVLVYIMFQGIFEQMLEVSNRNKMEGSNYVRFKSTEYFLTHFYKNPIAYITGNGMYFLDASYGNEISRLRTQGLFLGDIGLIGNYVVYGLFFLIGVLGICYKSLMIKINHNLIHLKYMIIAIVLSLVTGGGFANSDFICFICCVLYMMDASSYFELKAKTEKQNNT